MAFASIALGGITGRGSAGGLMRGKGINYDTGFMPGNHSRPDFDPAVVEAELRVIARDLDGAEVVLVLGCELSLFNPGYLPGTFFFDRIRRLARPSLGQIVAFGRLRKRLNAFLAEAARGQFGGPLTYAAAAWEPVDWSWFDIVSVDAYRDARNAASFRSDLRKQLAHGKPVVATEFGCCAYAGAADRGGMGWDIAEYDEAGRPTVKGEYERDESEQVRYLQEVNQVFVEEGLDLAFWFTFAKYHMPASPDPERDADLASHGLVCVLPDGPGSGYQGLGWRPRLAFQAMAALPVG
jgi:hypothetical protein